MKTFWTKRAVQSLEAIRAHIASEQPAAAERIGRKIQETSEILAMWPLVGHDLRWKQNYYFPVPGTKYILLYRIEPDRISVLLVVHGATDWRKRTM